MTHGILFDLDETLIDRTASIYDYAARFHSDFARIIRIPPDDFVRDFVRLDGSGYVSRETFFDRLAGYIARPEIGPASIASHFTEHAWKHPILMTGAKEGLLSLRGAGIPVGIVTNGGSRNQRQKLVNTGLAHLVDHVVISEEVGVRKPHPSIFLSACEALQIDPARSWYVGDNPALDIVGAHAVGLRTIWLRRSIPWPIEVPSCYTEAVSSLQEAFDAVRT
jgi:putative hydrolase of the HAD superfamily